MRLLCFTSPTPAAVCELGKIQKTGEPGVSMWTFEPSIPSQFPWHQKTVSGTETLTGDRLGAIQQEAGTGLLRVAAVPFQTVVPVWEIELSVPRADSSRELRNEDFNINSPSVYMFTSNSTCLLKHHARQNNLPPLPGTHANAKYFPFR